MKKLFRNLVYRYRLRKFRRAAAKAIMKRPHLRGDRRLVPLRYECPICRNTIPVARVPMTAYRNNPGGCRRLVKEAAGIHVEACLARRSK
jgi:hypothetical protein